MIIRRRTGPICRSQNRCLAMYWSLVAQWENEMDRNSGQSGSLATLLRRRRIRFPTQKSLVCWCGEVLRGGVRCFSECDKDVDAMRWCFSKTWCSKQEFTTRWSILRFSTVCCRYDRGVEFRWSCNSRSIRKSQSFFLYRVDDKAYRQTMSAILTASDGCSSSG